jgi:3-oxoacyl-[acyl-carrier-protein] synthase II
MDTARPVISAWSAVSRFGIGRAAFETGYLGTHHDDARARPVPDLDIRAELGRKNTRAMDRVTGLAAIAARDLLHDTGPLGDPAGTAVVLATAGSPQQMRDFTRSSLLAARPFHVDPAVVPNGVMNCAASQIAIRHDLTGPNATIATGRTAALFALSYATRLLRAGRADQVLVGASEEHSPTRSWLHHHRTGGRPPDVLGEGSVLFLLELPDQTRAGARRPLAEVLCVEHGVAGREEDVGATLARCLRNALDLVGDTATHAITSATSGHLGRQEHDAVREVLGRATTCHDVTARTGETASASAAFQLAAALTAPVQGITAITAVDPDGTTACTLIRTPPRDRSTEGDHD